MNDISKEDEAAWIQTYTGKCVTPFDLRPEQIDIQDIAHALESICRYTGHVHRFYSVAQHSVAVAELARLAGENLDVQFAALMHDAGEAYLSDIAAPLKRHPAFTEYRKLEADVDYRIREYFGIHLTNDETRRVLSYDIAMLTPERVTLLGPETKPWSIPPTTPDLVTLAVAAYQSASTLYREPHAFMRRFSALWSSEAEL